MSEYNFNFEDFLKGSGINNPLGGDDDSIIKYKYLRKNDLLFRDTPPPTGDINDIMWRHMQWQKWKSEQDSGGNG